MKKLKSILLLLLLSTSIHHSIAQETEKKIEVEDSKYVQANAEFLLIEAQKFFLLEDYKKTLAFLEQSIEVDGENHAAFFKMAETQLILEDYDLAQKAIDQAITIRKDNKYYYVLAAEIMKANNDLVQAASYYQLMTEHTSDFSAYVNEISKTYLEINEAEKALDIYGQIEAQQELTLEQKIGKARAIESTSDLNSLESFLSDQIQAGITDVRLVTLYIQTLVNQDRSNDALAYFDTLTNLSEDLVLLKFNLLARLNNSEAQEELIITSVSNPDLSIYSKTQMLGQYILENRSFEELQFADSAQNLINSEYPEDAIAIQSGALLYSLMAQKAPADEKKFFNQRSIESYRTLVRLSPNDFQAWIKILDFERSEGLYQALETDAEEALDLFPNQAILYTYYAAAFAGQEDFGEAKSLLQQALRMSFGNEGLKSLVYSEQAQVAVLEDNENQAIKLFEQAVGSSAVQPEAILSYARYMLEKGPQKAIDLVEPFLSQGSQNIELVRIKTQALFNLSKFKEADGFWDKNFSMESMNANGVILELKGDILAKLNLIEEAVGYWELAKASGMASNKIDQKIANKAYQ